MWNRIGKNRFHSSSKILATIEQSRRRHAVQPRPETLEDRQLMTASLAPLANINVPAQLGYQVPLDGSGSNSPTQSFTATSSNPDIQVSIAQGQFWTLTVSHAPANASDLTINNETMTFQLFQDLTPNTANRITNLTNDGYYTAGFPSTTPPTPAGKYIPRITSVASSGFAVVQGGSSSPTSTASSSGIPPIATEPVQQLAFTGQSQIAMANTGQPNSTDAQFFITRDMPSTTIQQAFDFNYTIFGQLVSGQQTLTDLGNVAVTASAFGEVSQPINPVVINAVTLSPSNPNGVLHVDTTSAHSGETATITVTATDPNDRTTVTRSFVVTVSAYNGPTNPLINFVPFANPVSSTAQFNTPVAVQLNGQSGFPNPSSPPTLSYKLLSQPAHGTISNFNSTNGTLTYTPNANYSGPDSFQYEVLTTGPQGTPATMVSVPATVTLTVASAPLVTVTGVGDITNKRHLVTQIVVQFSGAVNANQSDMTSIYRLALPGRHGSYTAKNAPVIKLKKAVYDSSTKAVTLTLRTPLALTRKKLQLLINGSQPSGLTDGFDRLIDGDHNGTPGGNAIAFLSKSGVTISSIGR
jgi:cyclophilin family peptidyl-prolyl cis-trans isomerase